MRHPLLPLAVLIATTAQAQDPAAPPRDVTPPTILPHVAGARTGGWYHGMVTVHWSVVDPESAASGCPPASVLLEGTRVVTCTSTSQGGSAMQSVTIRRDATAPQISVTGPVEGEVYALGESVPAAFTCEDSVSGVQRCEGSVSNGAPLDTTQPGPQTFAVSAADVAGNRATVSVHFEVAATATPPATN